MKATTKRLSAAMVFALLAALGGGPGAGCAAQRPSEDGRAEDLLRAHNEVRRKAGVPPLRWAPDLASAAHDRARRLAGAGCTLERDRLEGDVGENLLRAAPERTGGGTVGVYSVSPEQVIAAWAAEAAHYSYDTNSCAPGHDCLHYTQLVWRQTKELGCGVAICPSHGQVWVCEYRPAGNIVGRKPY